MFITGLVPVLVAVGAIPVVVLSLGGVSAWATAGLWVLLCAVAVAVDVAACPTPSALRVQRAPATRARRDESAIVAFTIENTGRRRMRLRLRDAWQPTAGAPDERVALVLAPGERLRVSTPLLPRRRGVLRSRFVVARALGPLGLAGRQRRIDAEASLRVLPPFSARRHLPSRLARLRELDGNTSVQLRGRGTEFDSLREYVRGDDVRSIDWRATARSATTMLRTWRPERDRHVVIVVDTGRTSATRVGDGVRLDAGMEAALLLAALATAAGDHVHLLMLDRTVRARVSRVEGAALVPALVDAMAGVEPQLWETDWDVAFTQVRAVTSRPSLVVLLTAQDEPEASRGFLAALPRLARRTSVVVGTATAQPTRGEPDAALATNDVADAYRAAAHERALLDAERLRGAIVRAGAESLVAGADELPPRLADHYLALKAAGRL